MSLKSLSNISGIHNERTPCRKPTLMDKSVQTVAVITNPRLCSFLGNIQKESQLTTCTGISTFTGFRSICIAVESYTNNHDKSYNSSLDVESCVLLTLMKIKLNCTYVFLSVIFKISRKTCQAYFEKFVRILSIILRLFVYWPSKESVLQNMPTHFNPFPETRIVLDCTEIPVSSFQCIKCRTQMYSHYKGRHTLKIMIGIAPSGLITFVSPVYGGKASDKHIFVNSNLLELCEENDAIMVDKGFHIEKECASRNIMLIRPPFRRNGAQLSAEDCIRNRKIARSRVHVERVVQRLKNFRILTDELSWNMVPYVPDVLHVISGIVNLSEPVLSDASFVNQ